MKIIQVIPGSGGTFYCQNCIRDAVLVKALRALDHDVVMTAVYFPLPAEELDGHLPDALFHGAINTYLKHRFRGMRPRRRWLERLLDAKPILKLAAKRAGSVRAAGLEDMTLSMLNGQNGAQASELERMVEWLAKESKPDIIHISNLLLSGMVPMMKQRLGCPIMCSLQDEAAWVESMDEKQVPFIWEVIRKNSEQIDAFVPVSHYYAGLMADKVGLPKNKMHVVYPGVDVEGYSQARMDFDPPTIGYLSRMTPALGLDLLLDAFIILRKEQPDLLPRLRITGGMTGDDAQFISSFKEHVSVEGLDNSVDFVDDFSKSSRRDFLSSLSVLSVPALYEDAYGLYLLEAMACGVPVVQPNHGAFAELVQKTGGGILYEKNDAETLASQLKSLLTDPEKSRQLGQKGREAVLRDFTTQRTAEQLQELYSQLS